MTSVMLSSCPAALAADQEPLTGSKCGLLPGPGPAAARPPRLGGGCRRGAALPPRWRLAAALLGAAVVVLLVAALATELVRARGERDALRADVEDIRRRLHDRDLLAELRAFEDAVYEEEAAMDEDDSDSESDGDSEADDETAEAASWQEDYDDADDDYLEYTMPAPLGASAGEAPEQRLRDKYADVLAGMADKLQQGSKGGQSEDGNASSSSDNSSGDSSSSSDSSSDSGEQQQQQQRGGRHRREISSASESGVPVIDESYGAPLPRQHNASSLRLYETLAGAGGPTLAPTDSPIKKHHRVSPLWSQPLKKYQASRVEEAAGHRGGTPAPPPLITRSSRVMDTDGDRSVRIPYNALQHRHHHRHHQRPEGDARPQELRLMPEPPTPAPVRKAHLAIKRKKLRALSKRKHAAGTVAPHHGGPRLLPAAHFYGDASNYTVGAHDRYRGNGLLRPANRLFADWTPSKWVHELGMGQHFSYEAGTVTVKRTGLYYVYAQIFYLDERSENGFKIYVNDEPVMQCSFHIHIPGQKSNTCFTASVIYIPENSRITIKDIGENRFSVFEKSRSFFGLMKLGNTRLL